jgi:multimeric flavodoxin WrbA
MSFPTPQKKVTLIMGSPRKNSNTHLLINEAARALTEQGIATEFFFPDDSHIRDCRGCRGCKQETPARCVIQDDMMDLYRMMETSDGMILAAPVYFGYVPAMTKAWLDRLVPYIGADLLPEFPNPCPVSFIFTQNVHDPALFEPLLRSFMDSVAMTGLIIRDYLIAPDCETGVKPLVTERPDLMGRAYALGQDLLADPE